MEDAPFKITTGGFRQRWTRERYSIIPYQEIPSALFVSADRIEVSCWSRRENWINKSVLPLGTDDTAFLPGRYPAVVTPTHPAGCLTAIGGRHGGQPIFRFCSSSRQSSITCGQGPTVPGGCIRLPPPLNGRVRYDTDQAFGRTISRAVVTCDSGHAVPGETESVCTNGIWVPALIPRCERQSGRTSPGGTAARIRNAPLNEWVTPSGARCLRFACTVTGSPRPTVEWKVNGRRVNLRASSDLEELADGSLQACNVHRNSHSGSYQCDVRNNHGTAFRRFYLSRLDPVWDRISGRSGQTSNPPPPNNNRQPTVDVSGNGGPAQRPRIRQRPLRDQIRCHSSGCIHVMCTVSGNPRPRVEWTRDGRVVSRSSVYSFLPDGSLRVCAPSSRGYTGAYRCTAENDHGSAFNQVTLQDHNFCSSSGPSVSTPVAPIVPEPREQEFPPTFRPDNNIPSPTRRPVSPSDILRFRPVIEPLDVTRWARAVSSGCILLACTAIRMPGTARPTVRWTKDRRALPRIRDYRILGDGSLEICRASPLSHSARYTCDVSLKPYGSSKRIIVISQQHPVWNALAVKSQDRIITNSVGNGNGQAPDIGVSPISNWVTAGAGGCMKLRCQVSGLPQPTVTWTFEDRRVNSDRYTIERDGSLRACDVSSDADAGRYRCDATNRFGSAWREISVSLIHPVWEEVEEDYIRPSFGNDDDPSQPDDNNYRTDQPRDPVYPPEDINNPGDVARPVIEPIPRIQDWVKTSGTGCMTIFCTTRSQPRPNILWRKDGVRIDFNTTPFADYSLLEEGSLRVCNLAASRHNGRYRCDVSNTRGSAYRSLDIHIDHSVFDIVDNAVTSQPDIPPTAQPQQPQEPTEGPGPNIVPDDTPSPLDPNVPGQVPTLIKDTTGQGYIIHLVNGCVKLLCEANGFPKPSIIWYKDSEIVDVVFSSEVTQYDDGLQVCSFEPVPITGQYQCRAENEFGHVSRDFDIEPKEAQPTSETPDEAGAPKMVDVEESVSVTDDNCLLLKCEATGDPLPLISWTLDNGIIGFDGSDDFMILDSGSLMMCHINQDNKDNHVGRYACQAANSHGTAKRTTRIRETNEFLLELLQRRSAENVIDPTGETQQNTTEEAPTIEVSTEPAGETTTPPPEVPPSPTTTYEAPATPEATTEARTTEALPTTVDMITLQTNDQQECVRVMEENDDLKQQLNRALVAVEEARSARRELWSRYNALSAANRSLHLELEGIKAARDKALLARDESRSQLQKALTERDDARRERDQVQTTLETDRESASTETAMMREELARCQEQRKQIMDIFNSRRK